MNVIAWCSILRQHKLALSNIVQNFCPDRYDQFLLDISRLLPEQDNVDKTLLINIYRALNAAWYNAPDTGLIHLVPSWGVLCYLLREFDL